MKSVLSGSKNFFLICWMMLSLAEFSQAQTVRKNDVIVTKNNEKIEAIIQEINASTIKYKKLSDPEGPVFTIEKTEISSILYGNGETEKYDEKPQIYYDEIAVQPPVTPYGKSTPKVNLPIKTVRDWDSNQLRANYKFYLSKSENYRKMGTIGLIGGVVLTGAGIGVMASSGNGNSFNDLGNFVGGYMMFLAGLGAGIPLTIVGFIKKKSYAQKALLVKDELRRRNEPLSLKVNPLFNPATQSAGLIVRVTF